MAFNFNTNSFGGGGGQDSGGFGGGGGGFGQGFLLPSDTVHARPVLVLAVAFMSEFRLCRYSFNYIFIVLCTLTSQSDSWDFDDRPSLSLVFLRGPR